MNYSVLHILWIHWYYRYRKNRIAVPGSSFYVFYNGTDQYPTEGEMKLSDAFVTTTDSPMLEVKVKVININYANHHNILDKCQVLREYSMFVEKVRLAKSQANPLEVAVQQCIQEGILREYLLRKGSEVINMLIAEYDYDTKRIGRRSLLPLRKLFKTVL